MNKKVIIVGVVILLILIIGGVLGMSNGHSRQSSTINHSNKDIVEAITRDRPVFLADNKPVIEVVSVKRLEEKWYVATIKSIHEKNMSVPVKVVLLDQGEPNHILRVIVGPDLFHSESQMANLSLPDSVILELLKS